jgi:hypothetical protein
MRVVVALSILLGIVLILSALMPDRPEVRRFPTINPLRVSSGLI